MKNEVLKSFQELDRKKVPFPMAVIYRRPEDFPKGCIARIFDAKTGNSTPMCIVRKTVEECREDIKKSGFSVKFPRVAVDALSIVESWL